MKQIKIVFTKSKKCLALGSWIIRKYTQREYSHVAVEMSIKDWGKSYFQASEGKVHLACESEFNKKHEIIKEYTLEVPLHIERRIKKNIWQNAGKPYGMWQNLGIVIVDIAKFFGYSIKNPFPGGQNCSELIVRDVVMELINNLWIEADSIKPHEVEEIVVKHLNSYIKSIN